MIQICFLIRSYSILEIKSHWLQGNILYPKLMSYHCYANIALMNRIRRNRNRIFKFWLPALLRKTSIFFFIHVIIIFLLYILGSFQEFTDSTQIFLLSLLNPLMVFCIFSSFFSAISYLYIIPFRKKNIFFKIILSVVIFTFTIIFYIFINFLLVWF